MEKSKGKEPLTDEMMDFAAGGKEIPLKKINKTVLTDKTMISSSGDTKENTSMRVAGILKDSVGSTADIRPNKSVK